MVKMRSIMFLFQKNEEKKAILETYTKEYSAEYQAQALIDIAKKLNKKILNLKDIKKLISLLVTTLIML